MKGYTLYDLPNDLWRKVKALAAMKGITIQSLIIDLLKKEIDKSDKTTL